MTAMALFFDMLKDWGLYDENNHNKSYNTYTHDTNLVQFAGLDESEKIKSTEWNYIWAEEANEFTYEDYIIFKTRLSGHCDPGELNQFFLSLNPIDSYGWIPTKAAKEDDVTVIHSTFMDNPFLPPAYVKTLTDLMYQDENFYRVYALGEWGQLEGLVYKNYQVIPEMPTFTNAKWVYGLDFGLVNPSALIKVYLVDGRFYAEERIYETNLTVADIIEKLSHEERGDIYGDPSAKMMIEEIRRAGYNAYEGIKDVKTSIDLVQRQTISIPASSAHLVREIQSYRWKKDPNDPTHFIPEVVKFNDHAMDAMRYAIYGLTERYGFATQMPGEIRPIQTLHYKADRRAIIGRRN
jgi:phage terminase large subunit